MNSVTHSTTSTTRGTCPIECDCSDYLQESEGRDICYADGTNEDRETSVDLRQMAGKVYNISRPPAHFVSSPPAVSARKIDIVRAQLMDKAKTAPAGSSIPKSNVTFYSSNRETSKVSLGYRSNVSISSRQVGRLADTIQRPL